MDPYENLESAATSQGVPVAPSMGALIDSTRLPVDRTLFDARAIVICLIAIGVGLVTAERTAFRPEPSPAPARAPYLVRLDPVAVLERRDAWVRVRYQGEKTPVIGWLPAAIWAVYALSQYRTDKKIEKAFGRPR